MEPAPEIVITGLGVVSPIGIGRDAYWNALIAGRSGVHLIDRYADTPLPVRFGGEVLDFDGKQYVTPRKSLKVMSREVQFGFAAGHMAWHDARLVAGAVDPERFGVVFGADMMYGEEPELADPYGSCLVGGKFDFSLWGQKAMDRIFPLWMLKYLPNMPACHIGISLDARGHNNTLAEGDVSSLDAVAEALRVFERGKHDVMIVGGVGQRINTTVWLWQRHDRMSHRHEDPAAASRPFDLDRDGFVYGEGAGALVLETRRHAIARGAPILARVLSTASACEPRRKDRPPQGTAIRRTITSALARAGLSPADIGHVNAHGSSDVDHDPIEAQAIRDTLADVPVTAPKSLFGNLGAGSGAVEMIASVLALQSDTVPASINYDAPDPACPVNVIHGEPLHSAKPAALVLNQAPMGQAVAVVIGKA